MSIAVDLQTVSKYYGSIRALENLSLLINSGEIIGLLGHNGAGKTTIIKLILGMTIPTSGKIYVLGRSLYGNESRELRMLWGYLPENVSFYAQLTGREVLNYFARLKRIPISQCNSLLEQVGLLQAANRRVQTYSKGMRQRLGLAQALLGKPRLLLLDKPTVGLDPIAARDFFQALIELRRQGTTVILSSHVLPGIEQYVDRVAILCAGRLQAWGTQNELRHQANLPLRISVRGHWSAGFWEPRLAQHGITDYQLNGKYLEVNSTAEQKIQTMRLLLEQGEIEDINVHAPSLEALYVHYTDSEDNPHV